MNITLWGSFLGLSGAGLLGACSTAPCEKGPATAQVVPVAPTSSASTASAASAAPAAPSRALNAWFLAGSAPQRYKFEFDSAVKHGTSASTRLRSISDPGGEFGTVMQTIPAEPYRGKRLRFSSFVRTDGVTGWSGLWMRIDRGGGQHGAFDNMQDRAIKGTTDWARKDVVLDVATDAETVNFGVVQAGMGTTWIDESTLEPVDASVASTALQGGDNAPAHCDATPVKATGNDALIEDVEDGDRAVRAADGRFGQWWLMRDDGCQAMPRDPSAAAPGGRNSSHFAMRGAARDCTGWGFDLGFSLNGSHGLCAYDASVYDGVYFWARSGQGKVAVHFRAGTRQTEPAAEGGDGTCDAQSNGCWDEYAMDITLEPTWKLYSAKWGQLKQMGWGKAVAFDVKQLSAFHWSTGAKPSEYREIWVDQVGFFEGTPPATPP